MPESHRTWLTRPGLGLPLPTSSGVRAAGQHSAFLHPSACSLPPPQTSRNPSSSGIAGAARGHLLHAVSQPERPQAWPLCNDQITGQAGRSDKRSIYFGAFSNPGHPHPADENGETGGSVTPGPVSRSRRRAQTELKTIPWHQGKARASRDPGWRRRHWMLR